MHDLDHSQSLVDGSEPLDLQLTRVPLTTSAELATRFGLVASLCLEGSARSFYGGLGFGFMV